MFNSNDIMGIQEQHNLPEDLCYHQQILSSLPYAILLEDDHRNIVLANNSFCTLFNIPVSPKELEHQSYFDVMEKYTCPVKRQEFFADDIVREMHPVKNQIIELEDGRILSRTYMPLPSRHNSTFHLWIFRDDTVEIKGREEAETKKKFFENVLNNLPTDIAVFSPDQHYLFLNPVAIRDLDLRKWMIGKTDEDYYRAKGKDQSIAQLRKERFELARASKKEVEWEEGVKNRDGKEEHHLRRISPIYDESGNLEMLIGYGININEIKLIQDQVKLNEKRFRDLFNYSKAIIFTHDLKGILLSANPALCEATGFKAEELIGKSLKQILYSEDHLTFDAIYLKEFLNESKAKGIFRILTKEGKKIYCLYENFKVDESDKSPKDEKDKLPKDEKDKSPYIIGFAQDVSERIKAEEELKEAKRLTEESARIKEIFLANMSHEIRTPMNGIIGISGLLERTNLQPDQKNYLKIINDSARSLLNIINDILDIEKIASGEVRLESIPFDIINTTNSIISLFEHTSKEKNVDLIFRNEIGERLTICGDPTRFNQMMNNLLSNAIKFTHKGGITVNARIEKETADSFILEFSVLDTGIGIEEDKLIKIFKPYIQASPETARKYGGTGLGLAITKNLVELQNGHIWVQSKTGRGSKFSFTIPYKKPEKGMITLAETEANRPLNVDLGNIKVLLAEDNQVNQLLARSILQFWGASTVTATTGTEVIELMHKEDFDLVLMDIQMPEKSGIEATSEIRNFKDHKKKNIPIIALTANALKGEKQKYIAVGMDDYLAKPFTEKELFEVMSRVLKNEGAFGREVNEHDYKEAQIESAEKVYPASDEKLYDMGKVNELARGNKEFILSLVKVFIDTVPATVNEMQQACSSSQWNILSKLAHKIKPTIDTMCMTSIKDEIRIVENDAKHRVNTSALAMLVNKIDWVIKRTSEQLREEFSITKQ